VSSFALLIAAVLSTVPPLPQAVQEFERGQRLAGNGDIAGAREAFGNAVRLSPGYAAPINELGILLVSEEKLPEAVAQFRKANAADPSFGLAYNNLGFVLRKLTRFGEAVDAYKSYVALEPKDAAGLFGLGEAYRGAGDQANALTAYQRCASVAAQQGNEKLKAKAEAAAAPLQKALGVSAPPASAPASAAKPAAAEAGVQPGAPASAPAVVPPEKVALANQRIDEALRARAAGRLHDSLLTLQEASSADPGNAQAVFELGKAYALLNSYPQAIEHWQQVLSMGVNETTRAAAQQNIEKAKQKMAAAGPATTPDAAPAAGSEQPKAPALPQEAQAAYNAGVKLYGQQKYGEALQQFERAIAIKPDFAHAFAARGSTYFAQKEYVRALNDYGQAMRLDRAMASPLFGVAEAYYAMGRKSDAAPYYQAYAASKAADAQPNLQEIAKKRLAERSK